MKTTSLELSRRLATKVKIETEWYWNGEVLRHRDWFRSNGIFEWSVREGHTFPAYTTDELMEWLPVQIHHGVKTSNVVMTLRVLKGGADKYVGQYVGDGLSITQPIYRRETSLPEALGLLAEYLVDNGIYKGKE